MAITLTKGSTTLTLDDDLAWTDEFAWSKVKASKSYGAYGSQFIDKGVKLAGRTITLQQGDPRSGWMYRSTVVALRAWADDDAATFTLTIRGVSFTVAFDHENTPIEAELVVDYVDPTPNDWYKVVLRFITI